MDDLKCDVCGFTAKSRKGLFMHVRVHNGGAALRMPCDGSIQDYKRHCARGERACAASRAAWRKQYHINKSKGRKVTGCVADTEA